MERCLSGRWCNIGNVVYGNVPQVRILSSPPKPENPAFYAGFLCFGGEDRDEEVPCGSRVGSADIRRGSHACVGNGVILSDSNEKALPYLSAPRILCGIFYVLAERTEMKGFLVVRVSAVSRHTPRLTRLRETALSCPIVTKKLCRISSPPHFMRDFLCFGGEDRAEGVPCGSRA